MTEVIHFPLTKLNYKELDKYIQLLDGSEIIELDYFFSNKKEQNLKLQLSPDEFILSVNYLINKYDIDFRIINAPFCYFPNLPYKRNPINPNKKKPEVCKKCMHKDCGGLWKTQTKIDTLKTIFDKPSEIVIEVTSKCIKKCDYCFNSFSHNGTDLSNEKVKEIIDEIAKNQIEFIRFTGGEPLVRKDLVDLLSYSKNKGLKIRLNTNGYLLTNDVFDKLIKSGVEYILISYNDIDDEKSYDALKLAAELNCKFKNQISIICGTIAFPKNIEILEKFQEKIASLKISGWELYRPIPDSLTKDQIAILVKKLQKFRKQNKFYPIANALPFCSNEMALMNKLCLGAKYDDGNSRMVVDPKGYLKPSYIIDKNLGPASDIMKAWNNSYMKKTRNNETLISTCKECLYLAKCKGGSKYFSILNNDSFDPLMNFELKHMVIKPTTKCIGKCLGCVYRQELYDKQRSQMDKLNTTKSELTIDEWKKVIIDAKKLGLKKITISGGEPTLYVHLNEIIKFAKFNNITTLLNTTGLNLEKNTEIMNNSIQLDAITFSLESLNEKTDAKIRGYNYAKKILSLIPQLKDKLEINVNTIITKYNYRELPELYNYIKKHNLKWILSYPEYDLKKELLMTKNDIDFFNKNIRKKIDFKYLYNSIFANGIYNNSPDKHYCDVPYFFILVLPNGDVHPCNIVEYVHEPVVGNLNKNTLSEIWNGKQYFNFRAKKHNSCNLCPIPLRYRYD